MYVFLHFCDVPEGFFESWKLLGKTFPCILAGILAIKEKKSFLKGKRFGDWKLFLTDQKPFKSRWFSWILRWVDWEKTFSSNNIFSGTEVGTTLLHRYLTRRKGGMSEVEWGRRYIVFYWMEIYNSYKDCDVYSVIVEKYAVILVENHHFLYILWSWL